MRKLLLGIKKRPIILIYVALTTAVITALAQFNGFTREFGSLSRLFKADYTATLSEIAGWLKDKASQPALMAASIIIGFVALFALAILCGLIHSGFSYVMYVNTYNGIHPQTRRPKKSGVLFKEGINKRFFSMSGYFFALFLTLILLVFLLAYAIMPMANSIEKVIGGSAAHIFPMIILTALVIFLTFFAVIFYSMYMSFMVPSIVAFKKGAVKVAFKIVNSYCWYLIPRTLVYIAYNLIVDVMLLALGFGSAPAGLAAAFFLSNWILRTIGNMVYTHFVFSTYIEMKDDMFDEG